MSRTRRALSTFFVIAFGLLFWVLQGCRSRDLESHYAEFNKTYFQYDLSALDNAGLEGALLIVGLLEMDSEWRLYQKESGDRYIRVDMVRTARREEVFQGTPFLEPAQPKFVKLFIRNRHVLDWAEKSRKAEVHIDRENTSR